MVLALLLLTGFGESRAQESGLLLGLRYDVPISRALPYYAGGADSLSRDAYGTLLITEQGGAFAILPEADHLLIPRQNRFWRVDAKRSVYNNWVEDFVWAAPEDAAPAYAGIQPFNGEYCEGHRAQTILYAGPRYLSLEQRSAGYCEGGAHPWFFNTLAVVPLDSTTHTGLSIAEVLGEAAYRTFGQAVETFLDGLPDARRRSFYFDEPDPANWGLARREGRWRVVGRVENAEAAEGGLYTDLPLAFDVPAAFGGSEPSAPTWRQVKSFAPDAEDAFVAPAGNWLILLRPGRLTLHAVQGAKIGPIAMARPLAPGTHAVMARWASGAQLRGWMQRLARLAQSGTPRP